METSKILTAVIPSGYETTIIDTSYGIEPIYGQHIGRFNRKIKSRVINRKIKIIRIYERYN